MFSGNPRTQKAIQAESARPPFVVLVDTREQKPWSWGPGDGVHTIEAALETGDYSFAGSRGRHAIERKSCVDFVSSLTAGRERFVRECQRMRDLIHAGGRAAIIVEASQPEIDLWCRRSSPWSVITTALSIVADLEVPIWFAGNRARASRDALWLLRRWAALQARADGATNFDPAAAPALGRPSRSALVARRSQDCESSTNAAFRGDSEASTPESSTDAATTLGSDR